MNQTNWLVFIPHCIKTYRIAATRAGIEIMSPHYANLRDGNNSTIPPTTCKDYAAPPFNVHQTGAGVK